MIAEVSHISNLYVLSLRFNHALDKQRLLGTSFQEPLTALDIQFDLQGWLLNWNVISTTPKLGSYRDDNVIQIDFQLEVPVADAFSYSPFYDVVIVRLLDKTKFISQGGTIIEVTEVQGALPPYSLSLGAVTIVPYALGVAFSFLPFCLLFVQMYFKFEHGNQIMAHSYMAVNTLQIVTLYALFDFDLLPNLLNFYKGLFVFAQLRLFHSQLISNEVYDLAPLKNMRALDISSNFIWNFINHMVFFCISFVLLGVAK